MRPLAAALLALPVLLLAACGGSGDDAPKRPVLLRMTGPGDGRIVRAGGVDVSGTVTPNAVVTVLGERVPVTAGAFSTRVPLDAGGNVIDVMASADGMAAAMTAVRVVRQLTVRVPDVAGDSPGNAKERLASALAMTSITLPPASSGTRVLKAPAVTATRSPRTVTTAFGVTVPLTSTPSSRCPFSSSPPVAGRATTRPSVPCSCA